VSIRLAAALAALVAWAAVLIWWRRRDRPEAGRPADRRATPDDAIDREELERAEREVRDLETDVRGRPLDDQVGDDWGPGTPKPPYV
jgi:hypothetical protein